MKIIIEAEANEISSFLRRMQEPENNDADNKGSEKEKYMPNVNYEGHVYAEGKPTQYTTSGHAVGSLHAAGMVPETIGIGPQTTWIGDSYSNCKI